MRGVAMMRTRQSRDGGVVRSAIGRIRPTDAACGFLLARGICGGSLAVNWSMSSLTGSAEGHIYGTILFAVGCAVVCMIRQSFGRRTNAAVNWMIFALYAVCGMLSRGSSGGHIAALVDGAVIICALLVTCREKPGARQIIAMMMLIPLTVISSRMVDVQLALRIGSLSGCLASAGLLGSAATCLTGSESKP